MVYDISYFANHIYKLYVRLSDGGHAEIQGSDEPPKASARKRSMPHAACRMPHPQGCRIYLPGLGSLLTGPTDYLITALNQVRNKKLQPETGLQTFQEMLAAVDIKKVAKYVPVERIGALQASLGPPAIHHDLRQPDPRKLVESDPITASRLRCPP